MALIKCCECDKLVSDAAASCPNCGCPMDVIKANIPTVQVAPTVQTVQAVKPAEVKAAPVVQAAPTVQAVEVKPVEVKAAPTVQAVEVKPVEVKAAPTVQAVEVKPMEVKPVEVKAAPTVQAAEVKPVEVKAAPTVQAVEVKPVEVKAAPTVQAVEVKPVEVKAAPVDQAAPTVQAVEVKPVEVKAAPVVQAAPPVQAAEAKPVEVKAAPVVQAAPTVQAAAAPASKPSTAKMTFQILGAICVLFAAIFGYFYQDIIKYIYENTKDTRTLQSIEKIVSNGLGQSGMTHKVTYSDKKYHVTINDTKGKEYLSFSLVCTYDKQAKKPSVKITDKKSEDRWKKLKELVKAYGDNKDLLQGMLEYQKEMQKIDPEDY